MLSNLYKMIMLIILFLMSMCLILMNSSKSTGSKLPQQLPPGPKPLPFIGSLIPMLRNKPTFRWIHRLMDEINTNIICIRLGYVHVIVVSDPKIAREFLKDRDEIFSSRPDCMSGYLASGGYLTTALVPMSDRWKKMRKILATEILSVARHNWLQSKRNEEADNMIRYIHNQCYINVARTKGVVHVRTIVQQYSSNIIRKIIFGSRYFGKGNADGGPGVEEIEHVDSLWTILNHLYAFSVTDYVPWLRWVTDFDSHEKIMRNAIRTARKYQDRLVDERIQQWKDGVRIIEDDLLDVFINLKSFRLTADQIKAQILELVLATIDNPSNDIEWAMAEMINQPRIFEKAIQELDFVVGKDRLVQEDNIPKLNYIKACVREAFRLHPVAPFNIPHVSSIDTTVVGYFIPKGSHVLLSRPGLGRNREVWDDPLTYNPDRHMKSDNEVVLTDHGLDMLSFSTGRRGCAGVLLGSTMTIMLLARLLHGFTWELASNELHVDLKENLKDLSKAKPLLALVKPRPAAARTIPHNLNYTEYALSQLYCWMCASSSEIINGMKTIALC